MLARVRNCYTASIMILDLFKKAASVVTMIFVVSAVLAASPQGWTQGEVVQTAAAKKVLPAFFSEMTDLPLMNGLAEAAGGTVVFEKSEGRIITHVAIPAYTDITPDKVAAFYEMTLPQLGWEKIKEKQYVRDGERLEYMFLEAYEPYGVQFKLTPYESR